MKRKVSVCLVRCARTITVTIPLKWTIETYHRCSLSLVYLLLLRNLLLLLLLLVMRNNNKLTHNQVHNKPLVVQQQLHLECPFNGSQGTYNFPQGHAQSCLDYQVL